MPTLNLAADGSILDYSDDAETISFNQGQGITNDGDNVSDPSINTGAAADYTDDELDAAVQFTNGAGSPEQASLDSMRARETFCVTKANEIASYDKDGKPVYVRSDDERTQLLRQAKGIRASLQDQLILSQRSIARRYLDDQKKTANAQATLANYAALEAKAREIAFNDEAQELANMMRKRNLGGATR
jgi:hypothetical protein